MCWNIYLCCHWRWRKIRLSWFCRRPRHAPGPWSWPRPGRRPISPRMGPNRPGPEISISALFCIYCTLVATFSFMYKNPTRILEQDYYFSLSYAWPCYIVQWIFISWHHCWICCKFCYFKQFYRHECYSCCFNSTQGIQFVVGK